jgi:4-amino-4-deoxy-L-arabinose transferase-like glycosyltransferase
VTTRLTTPAPAAASRWAWLWEPRGVLALLLGWAAFHAVLRLALSPTLTADDAREAVLAQSLQWGYQPRQPPLYNWLAWAAFRLLGPGLLALTLLKYATLVLAFWLVYLTARRVLDDPRLAALCAFSFLLIAPISWTIHEALTHSITVLAACAWTLYALIRLDDSPGPRAYALLGLAVGLGLLSKFTYVIFLAALGLAALSVGRYRARVLRPEILVTALVAALLVVPYAVWFAGHGHDLGRIYAREVRIEARGTWGKQARAGLAYIARFLLSYVTPVALAVGACFPRAYRRLPGGNGRAAGGRLIGWLLVWMLVLLAGTALAGGLSFLKARWLIPAFFLVPLYGLWRADRQRGSDRRLAAFAVILLLAEIAVVGFLTVRVVGASHFRRPYSMNEPYARVAAELERAGFKHGTIVAGFGTIAGNLAVQLPHARVLHTEYPDFLPPAGRPGQCLLVWDRHQRRRDDGAQPAAPPEDLQQLAAALDVDLTGSEPVGVIEAPFLYNPTRIRRVHYILLPDGAGRCR